MKRVKSTLYFQHLIGNGDAMRKVLYEINPHSGVPHIGLSVRWTLFSADRVLGQE